jgi:hypothetical protein
MTFSRPPAQRVSAAGSRARRLLLLAAAALLTAWSFVVPVFEAPDEHLHWQYARHLHDHAVLPIYGPHIAEGNSPPLYYALIAPVAAHMFGPPPVIWVDGTGQLWKPFEPRLHMNASGDLRRYWPIRWARLLTVLISLVTIGVCARLGAEAEAGADAGAITALLTAGLVAFLPQFSFRGSHVSNDALMTTMAACTLWGMVVMMRRGFTWRVGVWTAIALAAAYLSKISAICLAPALALVILIDTGGASWRTRVMRLAGVFAIVLAIVAPWSIRNVMLYGDPFASAAMDIAVAGIVSERSLWDWHHVTTLPRELFKSFIGAFGAMGVKLHRGVHALYLLFLLIAGAGLMLRSVRDRQIARLALVLAVIVVCNFAVVVNINLRFDQPQGRYMFPALPAVMLAAALGLRGWRPWAEAVGPGGRGTLWPAGITLAAWAAANVAILLFVVRPVYYPPLVASLSRAVTHVEPSLSAGGMEWVADVRVPAMDASFIWFDVVPQGHHPAGTVAGTIVFTLEGSEGGAEEHRVPFQWGGREPRTVVMMLKDPRNTSGTVTRVSVRLPDSASFVLRNFQLMGSLPSHNY